MKALGTWLAPAYGGNLVLRPDLDAIEALAEEREALWARLEAATFLTANEKREAVGYSALDEAAASGLGLKYSPDQPRDDQGRWTNGGGGERVAQNRRRPPTQPPASSPKSPQQPASERSPTIRNKDLAGKKHGVTGIPFDKDGFPDFSSVATKTVRLPHGHTGGRGVDSSAANKAAGLPETPRGMTWHHHQDGYTMQLVPSDIHARTAHTGSIGIGNTPGRKSVEAVEL